MLVIFPFVDGDTNLTGMTDEQWKEAGAVFNRIHGVRRPRSGFESIRRETFDPESYVRWISDFERRHLDSKSEGSGSQRSLRSSWLEHRQRIQAVFASLENLSGLLQKRACPHVICHGDLHPADLIHTHSGQVFVIDWDDVMLAPKERDFIFVDESRYRKQGREHDAASVQVA